MENPFNDYIKNAAMHVAKKAYVIDNDNQKAIHQLMYYFKDDNRFEGDLNKGLILQGEVGTGKTLLFRIFQKIIKMNAKKFGILTCRELVQKFTMANYNEILRYGKESYRVNEFNRPDRTRPVHYLFDDLGSEPIASHYGNKLNILVELITDRYEEYLKCGMLTHFTTNLSAAEIGEIYGGRIRSRLKEMCNLIPLNGKDRR